MNIRIISCVVIIMLAGTSSADDLSDLMARLEIGVGHDPLQVEIHVGRRSARKEQGEDLKTHHTEDIRVIADGTQLTLSVPEILPDDREEDLLSFGRIRSLINNGPALARELNGLKLVERVSDSYEGTKCQRLTLRGKESKSQLGVSASTQCEVKLWIGSEGYPLGALFQTTVTAKVLFTKMERRSTRQQKFTQFGGRLVVVLDEHQEDAGAKKAKAGEGQRTTITVKIVDDQPVGNDAGN